MEMMEQLGSTVDRVDTIASIFTLELVALLVEVLLNRAKTLCMHTVIFRVHF